MRTTKLLLTAIVAVASCGYDFETEKDLFTCASDDDCVDGFVCAGHTSVSDAPVTYCVENKDVEIGIWQETMPAFQSGCTSKVWEFDWDAWMDFTDNETPLDPLGPESTQRDAFLAAGGSCAGNVSAFGEVRVMCRMPKGEEIANTASMWVVLYDVGQDPFTAVHQQAIAFTSAAVDPDTRMAPAPEEIHRHHQFEAHLTDNERCNKAAAARTCPENTVLCGPGSACSADEQCPPHFHCDVGTTNFCIPNPE